MEGVELTAFQIIAAVGSARSSYIEAIQVAKRGDFQEAKELLKEGEKSFVQGHKAHLNLLQEEANQALQLKLILMHAEDQLMSAESFKIVAEELIAVHLELSKLR